MKRLVLFLSLFCGSAPLLGAQSLPSWPERYTLHPPTASLEGVAEGQIGGLPFFTCVPSQPGQELVRVSLPFAPGALPTGLGVGVHGSGAEVTPDLRVLTRHPGIPASVRRALITFPYTFPDAQPVTFSLKLRQEPMREAVTFIQAGEEYLLHWNDFTVRCSTSGVRLARGGATLVDATVLAPVLLGNEAAVAEVVEAGRHYLWARLLIPDAKWPRILEVRLDALGRLAVTAHLQRNVAEPEEYAPDFGWRIEGQWSDLESLAVPHTFSGGEPAQYEGDQLSVTFPDAHLLRRGELRRDNGAIIYARALATEKVPQQLAAWRTATFVVVPKGAMPLTALLEPPLRVVVAPGVYPALYPGVVAPNLKAWPALESSRQFHIDSMASATLLGDDFGNVTSMPLSGAYGMNRLNHCPPIFHAYYAHGDARLRELALHWCNNFHDLSIWWGDEHAETFGGTRYNNRSAANPESPVDPNFMWRSNDAVHFCTKGYDSFFYAWEETGDPRMAAALRWQVDYASRIVHANQGEVRNIGDVLDFTRLYEFTHEQLYLDNALRLFRELREKLSPGDLFSQSGAPIVSESPFLDVDAEGYQYPFAKPYIIGYALAGLPALAVHAPDEPKLNDVIRAVANFLAESQDPLGGWRYPHPRSSRVLTGQAIEHGAQIVRAAAWLEAHGEPIAPLLDAIERTLQARLGTYLRSGKYFNSLDGWERSTGAVAAGTSVQPLYAHPEDRDPARDYTEGVISLGDNSPEGVVYFEEVLDFYLRHRPAERLLNVTSQLAQVLTRIGPVPAPPARAVFPGFAIEQNLPTFNEAQKATLNYPLSWLSGNHTDFPAWRTAARAKLFESLLTPPPRAEFDPEVVAVENRGSYEARKLLLNISAYCRVPAYLLVPQGTGPFPAVVTLHDHGAHFSIGKEKVVRPFGVSEAVLADATDWVNKYYGQRWIGDALAEQGYVVFALDALFWGERGRKEGVEYKEQQTLSANLIQIGMTWPGVITWDDVRSAEFVASLPEVDPARIGAMGLSMGCHRTWTLCAATDRIAAGVAICWMGTTDALMVPGNNQTTGQSAYSMLVPNLRNYLDYPDVTSIACPKPMLFFNGTEDALFPVPGVEDAYARMHQIWESQGAADKLLTKLWPVPHEYNAAMQDEAFAWLAKFLMP